MGADAVIRAAAPTDEAAILALYAAAFPDEDLRPLVTSLVQHEAARSRLAESGGTLMGHGALTRCALEGHDPGCALLGPVAVKPAAQGQGVGGQIVRCLIDAARDGGLDAVLVLGDPAFYGRFGFRAEASVRAPYPLPPEWAGAWQSVWFTGERPEGPASLQVPAPWRDPTLWA